MSKQTENTERKGATVPSSRRRFLKESAGVAGGAGLLALGAGMYAKQASALPATAIRPPGALPEPEFLAACVRCGLCVRDCPYDTLKLAPFGASIATGTPYFVARDVPCYMCEDIPCVAACPTTALSKQLTDIRDADMGVAVVVGTDTCYSINSIAHCQACYLACPIKDEAITMEMKRDGTRVYFEPTVHRDRCTGCGKCEKDCVVAEAAIKVLPRALVHHDLGLATT